MPDPETLPREEENELNQIEKIRTAVADVISVPEGDLAADTPLDSVATLDSLSLAEIASALDEAFGVRLPSDGLSEAMTISDLAQLVDRAPRL